MTWALTATGLHLDYAQPTVDQISIQDIATGLANCCRFAGQCNSYYSVAQHSVMASWIVPEGYALAALLHDAAEAYIGDIVHPLKSLLIEYRAIEACLMEQIAKRFGLPRGFHQDDHIKFADLVMLATERRDLMPDDATEWACIAGIQPISVVIEPWPPVKARATFLSRFDTLSTRHE